MSVSIIVNDKTWWFGVRALLHKLIDNYYTVFKGSLTDEKWKLINEGEASKFLYVKDLTKSDFQEVASIVNEIVFQNITVNHKDVDHTLSEYKIDMIELKSVFMLDPRALKPIKPERYIIFNDSDKWIAPDWIWQLVTEWVLIHLQKNDFIHAAHKIEHVWKSGVEGYDLSTFKGEEVGLVKSTVNVIHQRYTSETGKNSFGCMQLENHGGVLVKSIVDLKSKIYGKEE